MRKQVNYHQVNSTYGRTEEGSVLYLYTKFQAESSIGSKIINGSQNWDTRLRDPGHAHLWVVLYSPGRRMPSFTSVPNLKRIAQLVQKLFRGSQNFEIGSCDPSHAHLGVVL